MEIRSAREEDLRVLAAMDAEIFNDTVEGQALLTFRDAWKRRIDGACLVAEENQEIIGAIIAEELVTFLENSSRITSLFVKKEWQGKGVGGKLMEMALSALKEKGYGNVSLTVALDNKKAISLYEKEGFRPFRMIYLKKI